MSKQFNIVRACSAEEISTVRLLFRQYAASLPVDLDYQDFDNELSDLPGKYAPPTGVILLAETEDGEALGCAALRPMDTHFQCEMKRLYVKPAARMFGVGPALSKQLVKEAQEIGYEEMLLDTLPTMGAAQALYTKLGFEPTVPYYDTPVFGTVFMKKRL